MTMDATGSELDNEITILVYASDKVELELDGEGEVKASYTYGSKLIKSETAYYVFNGYLDVVQLTDLDGIVIRDYDYDPYGVQLTDGEEDTNPFRYKSEYHDAGTGLIYLKNRFYDPSIGRFISLDPIRDGLNWYAYARNNPIMYFDPSGLVVVNFTDYITAQGGKVASIGEGKVSVTVNGTTTFWTLNSGMMDDRDINAKFGFSSFLSDNERTAGVGIHIAGGKLYYDITTVVANALNRDVGDFESHRKNNLVIKNVWFGSRVSDTGDWNLKYRDEEEEEYKWEETLGIPFWGYQTEMYLDGYFVKVEDVGNITYGYLGAATGFSQYWLNTCSALNHFKNHGATNWYNTGRFK